MRPYMTTEEAAEYLTQRGVEFKAKTLANQRIKGGGIPFLKLGRRVRYRQEDIDAWLESAPLLTSTSETKAGPR